VDATVWDFTTGWYGDYVDQAVINEMVDGGVQQLTGAATVSLAWEALLVDYAPGKAIAIKVNFNNAGRQCDDDDTMIDALIEPVNALIRSMKSMGVHDEDIWVYDASRAIPDRFRTRCLYPNVRMFGGACVEPATFTSHDPDAEIDFALESLTPRKITDVIVEATYLINLPIMKDHGIAPVSLGFKNHFGTINVVVKPGDDDLHRYIGPSSAIYNTAHNPLIEIFKNPHIQAKTVLTLGDGLFGAFGARVAPAPWSVFGDAAPNSLFFSTDPVATDCVMFDVLDAEPVYHPKRDGGDAYLQVAADERLGVYERGDPFYHGYDTIDYVRVEL
jgi:uncharacterized protein (DUF362 family)